jgi:hypothetical protein
MKQVLFRLAEIHKWLYQGLFKWLLIDVRAGASLCAGITGWCAGPTDNAESWIRMGGDKP